MERVKNERTSSSPAYYIINGITIYRVVASVVLLFFIWRKNEEAFQWLLAVSFFTDAIDGFLARKYKVVSIVGSRLDSIGDDLTVLMGIIGMVVFRPAFFEDHYPTMIAVTLLFLVQASIALYKFGKFTSFHTYLAKLAALFQGCFLILLFFLPEPPVWLFYAAALVTAADLIEETALVIRLREWKTDVKGIYWVIREKNDRGRKSQVGSPKSEAGGPK